MARSSLVVILCLLLHSFVFGQKDRYMVFFNDKSGSPYSILEPSGFLSSSAIERRVKHDVPVTEQDLPVNPEYVSAVKGTGAEVYFTTRWMNGLLIQAEPDLIPQIEALPFVTSVELVAPKAKLMSQGRRKGPDGKKSVKSNEVTNTQLSMLGLDEMHKQGFRGDGVVIAVLDSGFDGVDVTEPFTHIFNEGRMNLAVSKDFVYNSDNVFQYDDHGSEVFSIIAAFHPGSFTGGAYKASYQLYVTEEVPTEFRVEEYNWLFAAERADSAGAHIIQSSLGYYDFDLSIMDYQKSQMDGSTTVVSRAAQWAAERGIVVVVSAGNEGNVSWQIITAPADAKDVLAVASVDASRKRSNSSSIGPSSDQRVKPDVAALGVGTSVIERTGTLGKSSGTSLAAPLVTSLVAGILQRYPDLTTDKVLDAIRKTASRGNDPDYLTGYGVPNFKAVVNYLEATMQENEFEVFPNPFGEGSDSLVIRPRNPGEIRDCIIEIISSEGKSVLKANPNFSWLNHEYRPPVSVFPPGVYFLRIFSAGKKYTYKLVRK